jgi:hypothetical protein
MMPSILMSDVIRCSNEIFERLAKRRADLERYAFTINHLGKVNVQQDFAYQRTFNGLYGVRRNAEWRRHFYQILEQHKSSLDVRFPAIVGEIFERTGRVEASFASKLIATIDPTKAIYDSVVRGNLGLPNRTSAGHAKIEDVTRDYDAIQAHLDALVTSAKFQELRQRFDREFPDFNAFTDLKVLDFLIWQLR